MRGALSLLFGPHQFILHPILVAYSYILLYGFPFDPRIWLCFIVHDWGYWGCNKMDDPEDGKLHPLFGAWIMSFFGSHWQAYCLAHSRYFRPVTFSRLCVADKFAVFLTPYPLYLVAYIWGETQQYVIHDTIEDLRHKGRSWAIAHRDLGKTSSFYKQEEVPS